MQQQTQNEQPTTQATKQQSATTTERRVADTLHRMSVVRGRHICRRCGLSYQAVCDLGTECTGGMRREQRA